MDTATAYQRGYANIDAADTYHRFEVYEAIKAWKAAESDHAHTSFYGVERIRDMRAHWLGILRRQRALGLGF